MNQPQIQAFDIPFCDEPDDDVIDEPVSMTAYDRFELARAKTNMLTVELSLVVIQAQNFALDVDLYSQALDQLAEAMSQEAEAWENLKSVF